MKKKTNIKTMIRQIVREEVAMAIQEVITELKQPTQQVSQPKPKKKIIEKKSFSNNKVLNDVLNETADGDEWKKLGGDTYTTDKMDEIVGGNYGSMMSKPLDNKNTNTDGSVMGNVLNRDYSGVVKAMAKNSQQKRGN